MELLRFQNCAWRCRANAPGEDLVAARVRPLQKEKMTSGYAVGAAHRAVRPPAENQILCRCGCEFGPGTMAGRRRRIRGAAIPEVYRSLRAPVGPDGAASRHSLSARRKSAPTERRGPRKRESRGETAWRTRPEAEVRLCGSPLAVLWALSVRTESASPRRAKSPGTLDFFQTGVGQLDPQPKSLIEGPEPMSLDGIRLKVIRPELRIRPSDKVPVERIYDVRDLVSHRNSSFTHRKLCI